MFAYSSFRMRYLFRRTRDLQKTLKNHRFLFVFCISAFARRLLQSSKNSSKTYCTMVKIRVRVFFAVQVLFCSSFALLGCLLSSTWSLLGASWEVLGRSWAAHGCSWEPLGPHLGALGAHLGALRRYLGALGRHLGALGRHSGALGCILGSTWSLQGPFWAQLGASGGVFGLNLANFNHLQRNNS